MLLGNYKQPTNLTEYHRCQVLSLGLIYQTSVVVGELQEEAKEEQTNSCDAERRTWCRGTQDAEQS